MKRMIMLMAAVVPLSVALVPMAASAVPRGSGPLCSAVPVSAPPGAEVESVTAVAHAAGTVTFPDAPPLPTPPPITDVPARCDITVTLTHPGANDHVNVKISLPRDPKRWTGRFQATGGSAYLAGDFGAPVVQAVKDGYVAAATDAGVGTNPIDVSGWALTADGNVNAPLLKNFASRSVHDMAVVGKDVTRKFYGSPVRYAYWNGCSTGGRQGYEEAQAYPHDFDGKGIGPQPTDDLGALVNWVEKGKAPATLAASITDANGMTTTRNVCRYPQVTRYNGHGDPALASSYRCMS